MIEEGISSETKEVTVVMDKWLQFLTVARLNSMARGSRKSSASGQLRS